MYVITIDVCKIAKNEFLLMHIVLIIYKFTAQDWNNYRKWKAQIKSVYI
jgi:hypothetical protein